MRLCVFCGSSDGARPAYRDAAHALGKALADAGIGLVYGGAAVGLMGAVAAGALARGGEVMGVLPRSLADRELAHPGLTQLHVVGSMHERKAMMRSEEHTSELQSLMRISYAVFCLKRKNHISTHDQITKDMVTQTSTQPN